jgi:hypothetical protein
MIRGGATMAVNTLVLGQVFYLFNIRYARSSRLAGGPF